MYRILLMYTIILNKVKKLIRLISKKLSKISTNVMVFPHHTIKDYDTYS